MKKYFKVILSSVLLSLGLLCVNFDTAASSPKREMRGVWLATVWGIDWPSVRGTTESVRSRQQGELLEILDRCESLNLTTVFFQVRGMADVMYKSSLEPWSSFVSGKRGLDPGWDPLGFVVEECHKRGLECYAWVNPFRWSSGANYDSEPDKEWKRKGWLLKYDNYTVLNPGLEDVRQHVVDICREIVDGYAVDGLVFDDYFYPNRIPETSAAADYDLWRKESPWMSFGDWRRANVHKVVADVHAMIADTHPGVRFGISPAGVAGKIHTSALKWGMESCDVKADDWQYSEIYSDPLGWLYQRTVDFISPQIYWSTSHQTAPYVPVAQWWNDAATFYGCHFYSSMTLAPLEKNNTREQRDELLRQVYVNRSRQIDGNRGTVLYSAKFLPKISGDISGCFDTKVMTPPMCYGEDDRPESPGALSLKSGVLTWRSPDAVDSPVRYAVYAFPRHLGKDELMDDDGDGISGQYLLKISYESSAVVPAGMSYAVTTLSGFSVESEPVFLP
ncbi:MAG: family 10 glycosylhydrolase [Staphylococcus sp.]|nr:family 10 glycosylhydrolase [Staphylococcus sp.]